MTTSTNTPTQGPGADAWVPFTMPGSDSPVDLRRLEVEASGAMTVLVHFPAGWTRPVAGSYEVDEHVIFLEGAADMSGVTYRAGDAALFPAGWPRVGGVSADGALAVARFGGPPRWHADTNAEVTPIAAVRWADLEAVESPLGEGAAHPLPEGGGWVVQTVPGGRPAPFGATLFGVADHRWARVAKDQPLPDIAGPAWCRPDPGAR